MTIWIEAASLAIMILGVVLIFAERYRIKHGIGVRVIQLATIWNRQGRTQQGLALGGVDGNSRE